MLPASRPDKAVGDIPIFTHIQYYSIANPLNALSIRHSSHIGMRNGMRKWRLFGGVR